MTQPVYSAKQEQGGTDVGMTGATSPAQPSPPTPDVEGTVGPSAQTDSPWPGRGAAFYGAIDNAAATFAALAAAAQQSPGTVATTATTGGASNS